MGNPKHINRRAAVPRRVLRTPEAAEYLGLAASTLEKKRLTGGGPRFVRLGRAIGYDFADLDAWLDGHREPFVSGGSVPPSSDAA